MKLLFEFGFFSKRDDGLIDLFIDDSLTAWKLWAAHTHVAQAPPPTKRKFFFDRMFKNYAEGRGRSVRAELL